MLAIDLETPDVSLSPGSEAMQITDDDHVYVCVLFEVGQSLQTTKGNGFSDVYSYDGYEKHFWMISLWKLVFISTFIAVMYV